MRKILIVGFLLALVTLSNAQDYFINESSNAVMLQVNENTTTETRLNNIIILLPNGSNLLSLSLGIPYHSINYKPADDTMSSSENLLGKLIVPINPWQVIDELTSAKTFVTKASLTLNNITKAVLVKYMPLPAGTELLGNFNVSMMIEFSPGDFNLTDPSNSSKFVIKISDTPVARL